MEKQVVVSVDPMNIRHNVIEFAEELARSSQAELLIYGVQGMPVLSEMDSNLGNPGIDYVPGAVQAGERITTELFETLKSRYPDTKMEYGPGFMATSTINKMEELEHEEGSSCILVMPKTSDHGWWNNVLGTTETAVAASVSCPVLFVPDGGQFSGISRVMYLADSQSVIDGKYKGFRFLRNFADTHGAQVVIGFIIDPLNDEQDQLKLGEAMDNFKNRLPFQFNHEYRFFMHHSAEEILEMANLTHTDIVAFPFRESNVFARFFDNEITRTLVLKTDIPVLVF